LIEEAIVEGAREIGDIDLERGLLEARDRGWERKRERRDGVGGEVYYTEEREGEKDGDGKRERPSLHRSWMSERQRTCIFLGNGYT
jgi:hypothetical protein